MNNMLGLCINNQLKILGRNLLVVGLESACTPSICI